MAFSDPEQWWLWSQLQPGRCPAPEVSEIYRISVSGNSQRNLPGLQEPVPFSQPRHCPTGKIRVPVILPVLVLPGCPLSVLTPGSVGVWGPRGSVLPTSGHVACLWFGVTIRFVMTKKTFSPWKEHSKAGSVRKPALPLRYLLQGGCSSSPLSPAVLQAPNDRALSLATPLDGVSGSPGLRGFCFTDCPLGERGC